MAGSSLTHLKNDLRGRFGRFFYEREVPFGLALFRIFLPLSVLIPMVPRWVRARELYSADGAPAPLALTYGFPGFLPELPGEVVVAIHSVLLLALVASMLGWCTRISLLTSTVLYTYLNMHDSLSTMTKYSVIATHGLFLMSLSHCGAVWSIDAWRERSRRRREGSLRSEPLPPAFPVWPRRLVQIFIGVVYFGAAVTKIHTPAYFSGEQLQTWMITNYNLRTPLGDFLSQFPSILVMFAYIAVVWEMLFLFICWKGWSRAIMLLLGVIFHVMTGFTLGLDVFPVICISFYFAFLDAEDVTRLARWWNATQFASAWRRYVAAPAASAVSAWHVPERLRMPSPAVFSFAAALVALGGVEIEYLSDPYGIRRPEGMYELKPLDADYVAELLTPSPPIRDKDKITSLETGTLVVGGHLLDRRTEFRHGDMITAEFGVSPPHQDMWIECNLHDARDRLVHTAGLVVSREMMRGSVCYEIKESYAPGDYWVVLKAAGKEMLRKPITLRAAAKSPVAN